MSTKLGISNSLTPVLQCVLGDFVVIDEQGHAVPTVSAKMEPAIVYEIVGIRCDKCLSLPPEPPVYHHYRARQTAHFLCCKCQKDGEEKCSIESCEENIYLCKLTSFLLTRMKCICPDKSPLQPNSSCPFCATEGFPAIEDLMSHFDERHAPTEIKTGQLHTLTMEQGTKVLKLTSPRTYLLLRFNQENLSLHHMSWDEPRDHELHVRESDRKWSCVGVQTLDAHSVTKYFELPLFKDVTVDLQIGKSKKVKAMLDIPELPDFANLSNDADLITLMQCILCFKINTNTPIVVHCTFEHPVCLTCRQKKAAVDSEKGLTAEEKLRCSYCGNRIMACKPATYILKHARFYCPNKSIGCQQVLKLGDYEAHICACLKEFRCPVCGSGFEDSRDLVNHFADHKEDTVRLKLRQQKTLFATPGPNLIKLVGKTNDDGGFMLMFRHSNRICLQHMGWEEPADYALECYDMGSSFGLVSFEGKTHAMKKFPTVDLDCLRITDSAIHPNSELPIAMGLTIMGRKENKNKNKRSAADEEGKRKSSRRLKQ